MKAFLWLLATPFCWLGRRLAAWFHWLEDGKDYDPDEDDDEVGPPINNSEAFDILKYRRK